MAAKVGQKRVAAPASQRVKRAPARKPVKKKRKLTKTERTDREISRAMIKLVRLGPSAFRW